MKAVLAYLSLLQLVQSSYIKKKPNMVVKWLSRIYFIEDQIWNNKVEGCQSSHELQDLSLGRATAPASHNSLELSDTNI